MRHFGPVVLVLLLLCGMSVAQEGSHVSNDEPIRIGPGVQAPRLQRKEEPHYTPQALRAGIQGEVLLSIVIDKAGVPKDISILSPLGFGLDEAAMQTVEKWRFHPALKDGEPVNVRATVDVNFRLSGEYYDEKAERDRTRFNALISHLNKDGQPSESDVKEVKVLVRDKLPAAEYILGVWEVNGTGVPQDKADGLVRIQRAADKYYGPAMFFVGNARYRGTLLPYDKEEGLKLIRDSAVLGSVESQYMLGQMCERGIDMPVDREKAKRYYRLCAAKGNSACEFRLGQLLLVINSDREDKRLEAAAWLALAEDHHVVGADKAAEAASAGLTEEQKRWVSRLKGQLERGR